MKRSVKLGSAAAAAFVVYAVAAWAVPRLLGVRGGEAWLLRGALWLVGLAAAGIVGWYVRARRRATQPRPAEQADAEIDALLDAARRRLAGSAAGRRLETLPVVLLVGPAGAAKSTVALEGGLAPELLAGTGGASPTASLNAWYARDVVLVEAGEPVLADPARWTRLARRLRPPSLRAALTGAAQPPRVALVCVGCDAQHAPGGGDALGALADATGAPLPVYAVFTKADQLPAFGDYVRNLTDDEAAQVVGATFPLVPRDAALGDERAASLGDALRRLVDRLGLRRVDVMGRQYPGAHAVGAYVFPRELGKLLPLVQRFLVELGRPSQLRAGGVLRGVYFTGRRIVVQEEAVAPLRARAPRRAPDLVGATDVFRPADRGPAADVVEMPVSTSRRVAQPAFLSRLLPDVVLADHAALAIARGGARPRVIRRALLATAALALLAVAVGALVSYAGNRAIARDALAAARALPGSVVAPGEHASADALQRLDAARGRLAALAPAVRRGPPWHLRFGLWSGDRAYGDLRRAYFASFDRQLLDATRAALLGGLRGLDPAHATEYGPPYARLKAYLVTTEHPEKSTAAFLAPVLVEHWRGDRALDAPREALAQRQFAYYGDELPVDAPLAEHADRDAVARARDYLHRFATVEPVYQSLLAEAGRRGRPVQFALEVPAAAGLVVAPHVVPGAFTRAGYAAVEDALRHPERLLATEGWVLGEQSALDVDRESLTRTIAARYLDDYQRHWRLFLDSAAVARFANLGDATQKLQRLGGAQSPLLALLALASRHTAVSAPALQRAFQPLHAVMPPDSVAHSLVGAWNKDYASALIHLEGQLEAVGTAPVGDPKAAAVAAANTQAVEGRTAVRQLAQGFTAPEVGADVQRLMEAPFELVAPLIRTAGSAEAAAGGQGLCAAVQRVLARYPFNSRAQTDATADDVADVFNPMRGQLSTFYNETGQRLLVREGATFRPRPGAGDDVNPAFVRFLNRASQVSTVLYQTGGMAPSVVFTLRPTRLEGVDSVTATIDDRSVALAPGSGPQQFTWTSTSGGRARLALWAGGTDITFGHGEGPWSVFRLFQGADRWQQAGDGGYEVTWLPRSGAGNEPLQIGDRPPARLVFALQIEGGQPILRRDYFAGMSCPNLLTAR